MQHRETRSSNPGPIDALTEPIAGPGAPSNHRSEPAPTHRVTIALSRPTATAPPQLSRHKRVLRSRVSDQAPKEL
jgi:hypothetical protein